MQHLIDHDDGMGRDPRPPPPATVTRRPSPLLNQGQRQETNEDSARLRHLPRHHRFQYKQREGGQEPAPVDLISRKLL